ncbi:MAG: hypothetical protein JRD84_13260, partial [Deltaproteobacteria bacterium]|nr:hypothetical protein [Deltaproteobacteria bacterium]
MDSESIGSKFRHLLAGKIKNRPLVWLWGAVPSFAVQNVGFPVAAAYNDPQKSFDAQIETIAQFGDDGIPRMAVGGASDVTWAFGGTIKWPVGEYAMAPTATHHPANSEAEAEALSMPDDAATAGPLPLYLVFAKKKKKN